MASTVDTGNFGLNTVILTFVWWPAKALTRNQSELTSPLASPTPENRDRTEIGGSSAET